jgi:hypothetical protein
VIVLALEEFAAKRRTAQEDLEKALRPRVQEAVDLGQNTRGWDELLTLVRTLYMETYAEESGDKPRRPDSRWTGKVLTTLRRTKNRDKNSVERITVWLATAILARATAAAAQDDPEDLFLEWVDMGDKKVRQAHADANGQQRPIGDKFNVGGQEMDGPGDPSVDLDLWINCRCTVRPVLASEVLVASAEFISEKPWSGAASRFTPEQWKSSCILHVCDGAEKSCHKLPIKEPGGALSRAGVHAAAGRIGSVDAPPDKIASAKRALRGAYKQLGEDPPDSLTAGGTMDPELDEIEAPDTEAPQVDLDDDMVARVPWHGILAPENVRSGDGRKFASGSLTWRDLPLPLTWQKSSGDGHSGSVVVGMIEQIEMKDGLAYAEGHMIDNDESDELVGLIAEFGKFGVSVDADDAEMEMNDEDETVEFTLARICSAAVVAIPAFAEAFVALGPWEDGPQKVAETEEEECKERDEDGNCLDEEETEESLAASAFAPGTEDGPGWLTHPVDTDRLRDYWTHGAGAAKIGWGTGGDFNRCRLNLAKYIKPNYLSGYCANRHKDALGIWPGEHNAAKDVLTMTEQGEAVHLVASAGHQAPAAWFTNPNLTEPTHITVTDEGRVYGHIAQWGVCHIGFKGVCTEAPRSMANYAYFLTGQVPLDDGTRAATGPITLSPDGDNGGHAGPRLSARAAVAHYDNTCFAVADVTVGEDEHGIWCSGWARPGVTPEAVNALMASDVSGDWREIGGNLEMVAALGVNVGGFSTPRAAVKNQAQVSLVAAGVIHREPDSQSSDTLDPDEFAERVAAAIEGRQARREKMAALAARIKGGQSHSV